MELDVRIRQRLSKKSSFFVARRTSSSSSSRSGAPYSYAAIEREKKVYMYIPNTHIKQHISFNK